MLDPDWNWPEELGIRDVLLTAPPGCGKTEQLANYVAWAVTSGAVEPPRRLLALCFSNKATANLKARIGGGLTRKQRDRILVTNFHGLSYRLYRCHGAAVGLDSTFLLPQAGWLAGLRGRITAEHGGNPYALGTAIRIAKERDCGDDELFDRLAELGGEPAVAYERALRASQRLDFDDALRFAERILRHPIVNHLYRCRFAAVVVDECQDLSPLQYSLTALIGDGRTLYGGDRAQGIYGFAGARADWVYDQIKEREPAEIRLTRSHRSSPAVLRVVSALSMELGGDEIVSADPSRWGGRGTAAMLDFNGTEQEAAVVLRHALDCLDRDKDCSVGILARSAWRRRALDALVRREEIPCEIWDFPVHRPKVVALLRRHIRRAYAMGESDSSRLQELYLLCHAELEMDLDHLDELNEAFETLEELVSERPPLDVIAGIRTVTDQPEAVSPGLHLLTGHVGKGQQFDHVVILGLEEGILPDYRAKTPEALAEELAVLHVMASRAKESLLVTVARDVRHDPAREWIRQPSRWANLVRSACASGPDPSGRDR